MDRFKALLISKASGGQTVAWTELGPDQLMDGDVDVKIACSTINYKDALAITGRAPIVRRWPMIPGIDFAGTVVASANPEFSPGDEVILNGWGVGESHMGGYAQMARVNGDWLIHKPESYVAAQTMAIGTAGFTAMLAVMALEEHAITPQTGPVLVTGAAGGVGSIAVAVLATLGFEVIASTGRAEEADFLRSLGASDIVDRAALSEPAQAAGRLLGRQNWAGAIDVAGSHTLANVLRQTSYGGCVAACGLAQGMDLPASVAPFILRGITLAGINSVMVPKPRRIKAWDRLARDLGTAKLASLTTTRSMSDVVDLAPDVLAGKVRGRIVLEVV